MSFFAFYEGGASYTNYLAGVIETITKDDSPVVTHLI